MQASELSNLLSNTALPTTASFPFVPAHTCEGWLSISFGERVSKGECVIFLGVTAFTYGLAKANKNEHTYRLYLFLCLSS